MQFFKEDDTQQRLQHVQAMLFDCPIEQMDSGVLNSFDMYQEQEDNNPEYTDPKKTSYYLVNFSSSHLEEYHEILVFWSLGDVVRYMIEEYTATVAEPILKFTLNQLLAGQTYHAECRMGNAQPERHIVLVHDSNLRVLYSHLKKVIVEDEDISLWQLFQDAETKSEVEDIIDYYNECQDNVW